MAVTAPTPCCAPYAPCCGISVQTLSAVTTVEESDRCIKKQLPLDQKKRMNMNVYYEIHELQKDLAFLEQGEEALFSIMRNDVPGFAEVVCAGYFPPTCCACVGVLKVWEFAQG